MKKFALILVILAGIVFLTGCNCCPTCPSPVGQSCSLKIITGVLVWEDVLKNVWGTVYVNGQSTEQKLDYQSNPVVIIDKVPCNQKIYVTVVDLAGCVSHVEEIFTVPGENVLYFDYW